MIAKIILNTVINLITKQITKVLGDKITIQSMMKLCFLGAGVMFFVLGFDLLTIITVLIIIICIGGYFIYFKGGKTPLSNNSNDNNESSSIFNSEEKELVEVAENLEEKTEKDPALLLRFPELDSIIGTLSNISKDLNESEDEINKKQNSNLIDITNSLLEETTQLYELIKNDENQNEHNYQKLEDISSELKIELDSLLVKYQDESNKNGEEFILKYKNALDDLLLKIKKKN